MDIVGKDGNIIEAYGLLDQGSEVTLIDQRAADELGLECEISKTQFHTFHNRDPVINAKEVSVTVSSLDKASSFKLENCYAVPKLNLAKRDFNWKDLQQRWLSSFGYRANEYHSEKSGDSHRNGQPSRSSGICQQI